MVIEKVREGESGGGEVRQWEGGRSGGGEWREECGGEECSSTRTDLGTDHDGRHPVPEYLQYVTLTLKQQIVRVRGIV